MGGALLENLVVAELFKTSLHRGEEPAIYFWRTAAGSEVDLVIESQSGLIPVEIKSSATAGQTWPVGSPRSGATSATARVTVMSSTRGQLLLPLGDGTRALPLAAL